MCDGNLIIITLSGKVLKFKFFNPGFFEIVYELTRERTTVYILILPSVSCDLCSLDRERIQLFIYHL